MKIEKLHGKSFFLSKDSGFWGEVDSQSDSGCKRINDTPYEDCNLKGKFYVDNNRIFLCQDVVNGAEAPDRFGYRYSFVIVGYIQDYLVKWNVRIVDREEKLRRLLNG